MWLGGNSPVIAFLDEQELSKWKQRHVFLNFSLQLLLSSTVMEHSLEYGFLFYIQEVQPSILMKKWRFGSTQFLGFYILWMVQKSQNKHRLHV